MRKRERKRERGVRMSHGGRGEGMARKGGEGRRVISWGVEGDAEKLEFDVRVLTLAVLSNTRSQLGRVNCMFICCVQGALDMLLGCSWFMTAYREHSFTSRTCEMYVYCSIQGTLGHSNESSRYLE